MIADDPSFWPFLPQHKGSSIKVVTPEVDNEFNANFLCDGEQLEIENQEIRKQVCGLMSDPYPLKVASYRVRTDQVVSVIFFPKRNFETNLIWIKETEW